MHAGPTVSFSVQRRRRRWRRSLPASTLRGSSPWRRPALSAAGRPSPRSTERGEIRDDVGQLLRTELVLVGRHRRRREDSEFLQIGFLQGQELFLIGQQLKRERVFIQPAAVDRAPVLRDGAHRPVDGHHQAAGIQQRLLDRRRAPGAADVAQVRRHPRSGCADAMTVPQPFPSNSVRPRPLSPSFTTVVLKSRMLRM